MYTTPHDPHNEAKILPVVRVKSFTAGDCDDDDVLSPAVVDAPSSAPPRIVNTLLVAMGAC